ncbi:hypothetical protein OIU34_34540 [Pararhizobium sp. BT-229]|uniref:hypothetical protein n=1 Tax=Pararhizobium sp. BT-229 TaxID=2986923 RepID=UPI0021F70C57|nr:hypothetical protein [Pararhizobium sp. BT-229]MCV9966960.1 hypothetical protein [Pararhizobium sp. BT-229]
MLSRQDAFLVSGARVADCREELEVDLPEFFEKFEGYGFTRLEILVALSDLVGEEFAAVSGAPRLH